MKYFKYLKEQEKLYIYSKIFHKPKEYFLLNSFKKSKKAEYIAKLYIKYKKPLSKIFKEKYFWNFKFFVNNNVLDPRPHTESIIEKMIENHSKEEKFHFLDLCCGSAVIACTICLLFPNATCVASDICPKALYVARKNIKNFNLSQRIKIVQSDCFKMIKGNFDILLSNPPYLTFKESKNLHFEPQISLTAGDNVNYFYKEIAKKQHLFKEIYLEVPKKRKNKIKKLFNHKKIFFIDE